MIDQVICALAFFCCASSPAAVRYRIPEITKPMIAKTPKIPKSQFMIFEMIPAIDQVGSVVALVRAVVLQAAEAAAGTVNTAKRAA